VSDASGGRWPQIRGLRTAAAFTEHLAALGLDLPLGADPAPVLGEPAAVPGAGAGGLALANRFAILPMEGWDGTPDGGPTELVVRRWQRFGASGAGLVWGGEAVAVRSDGRANPRQLVIGDHVAALRTALVDAHRARFTEAPTPVVGLQLTHSGRFARPGEDHAVLAAHRHPVLDARTPQARVATDGELDDLVDAFVRAACVAADAGFDFVDVKACHGYLGHELLAAHERPGRYGGSLEHRTRFVRAVIAGARAARPALAIGVRLSVFDPGPFTAGPDGRGVPEDVADFEACTFAPGDDLSEALAVIGLLADDGVGMVCITGGSPYYCPHAQRPAFFPPSDGYLPPEDPLVGVARLLHAARVVKAAHPDMLVVGSGFSYLQEWLPAVAAGVVGRGWMDVAGLGRMALSYPGLPADVLAGRTLDRRHLCRTFSDCTTAPRNGLVSGCYPLDEHYKAMPERRAVAAAKRAAERRRGARR
jgi:2,4-dienoyl-CoA reductase-like NADH-dependent reductase (Old Yellow Enzyme family)